ncbi:hypothetical protein BGZ46_000234, partial [Entomortierella lignicola]
GVTCSNNHPSVYNNAYANTWNIDIASSTAQANESQLTTAPANSIPASWSDNNEASRSPNTTTQIHCATTMVNDQIQRPKLAKTPHLQVMTSLETDFASMYPQTAGSIVETSAPSLAGANNIIHSSMITPTQHYHWGIVPSPVESSFNSGSSTPSFASMSPALSYSSSELGGASCDSSRPTSPMFNHPGTYEYLTERRLRKLESESSLIIRSRKSSTSSTSSNVSQRRMSTLRESTTAPPSPSTNSTLTVTSTTSPNNQCVICGQCFAGPAVLVRHVESIHEKLLWNCVGCKSNLSRRDAVTRHINLSPMDSICRAVGTIGQIKMINGSEIHYEVSSYRAKPLDEVMSRMGKKISTALKREIDLAKARGEGAKFEDDMLDRLDEDENEDADLQIKLELDEEYEDEAGQKKRRRPSLPNFARKK